MPGVFLFLPGVTSVSYNTCAPCRFRGGVLGGVLGGALLDELEEVTVGLECEDVAEVFPGMLSSSRVEISSSLLVTSLG